MRMKKIVENRTLKGAATEFIAFKRAQKIRERTLHDYEKYINPFIEQSSNSMDVDVLKKEILEYFANIPTTSPARYNHPYQYLHALFAWCSKQDYLPYNPFDKLELKKLKDEGNIKPATIEDIQSFLWHQILPLPNQTQFCYLLAAKWRRFVHAPKANGSCGLD